MICLTFELSGNLSILNVLHKNGSCFSLYLFRECSELRDQLQRLDLILGHQGNTRIKHLLTVGSLGGRGRGREGGRGGERESIYIYIQCTYLSTHTHTHPTHRIVPSLLKMVILLFPFMSYKKCDKTSTSL